MGKQNRCLPDSRKLLMIYYVFLSFSYVFVSYSLARSLEFLKETDTSEPGHSNRTLWH